jgi:hypothetical protein
MSLLYGVAMSAGLTLEYATLAAVDDAVGVCASPVDALRAFCEESTGTEDWCAPFDGIVDGEEVSAFEAG